MELLTFSLSCSFSGVVRVLHEREVCISHCAFARAVIYRTKILLFQQHCSQNTTCSLNLPPFRTELRNATSRSISARSTAAEKKSKKVIGEPRGIGRSRGGKRLTLSSAHQPLISPLSFPVNSTTTTLFSLFLPSPLPPSSPPKENLTASYLFPQISCPRLRKIVRFVKWEKVGPSVG